LGGEQLCDHRGVKSWLIAKCDDRGIEGARKLAEGGDAGADGRGHALGPSGVFDVEYGQAGERGADFLGVGAEDDDDRPGTGGERGLGGADDEGLAVE
jgi:hypothetical protein